MHIVCSRFDNKPLDPSKTYNLADGLKDFSRIGSVHPKKITRIFDRVIPLSHDEKGRFWNGHALLTLEELVGGLNPEEKTLFITTTHEECFPFSARLSAPGFKPWAINDLENWMSEDLEKIDSYVTRWERLKNILEDLQTNLDVSPGLHTSIFNGFNIKNRFKVERSLRIKNKWDLFFFYTQMHGYSETFCFMEDRPDRAIIVMDIRSMFPWCLTQRCYSVPGKLEFRTGPHEIEDVIARGNGVWKTFLTPRKDRKNDLEWLKNHHYFRISRRNTQEIFHFNDDDTLEIWLHASELPTLSRWFEIQVMDGIFSPETLSHPLAKEAERLFALRSDPALSSWEKKIVKKRLLSLHGCMNPYSTRKHWLAKEDWVPFWDTFFQSDPFDERSRYCAPIAKKSDLLLVKAYDIEQKEAVYSLLSQTLALSRSRMLEWMTAIHDFDADIDFCYSNVDSLHVSLPLGKKRAFIQHMMASGWLGEGLGQARIEAEGDSGIWLDVGKYLVFNKGDLVLHAGAPVSDKPFQSKKIRVAMNRRTGEKKQFKNSFLGGLSFSKKLFKISSRQYGFKRKYLSEITESQGNEGAKMNEKIRSWKWRMGLYRQLIGRKRRALSR